MNEEGEGRHWPSEKAPKTDWSEASRPSLVTLYGATHKEFDPMASVLVKIAISNSEEVMMGVAKFAAVIGISLLLASCAPMQTEMKGNGGARMSRGDSMADIKQWYWNMYGSESPYEYLNRQEIEAEKEATRMWYWKMYGKESPYYRN